MVNTIADTNAAIWSILETVMDPEVPVLSVVDLGVIRAVAKDGQQITVTITPTYTGCPAMDMIAMQIRMALMAAGYEPTIKTILSPAWTTDWMTEKGKQQLKAYGIAPPIGKSIDAAYLEELVVPCPQCQSTHTVLISQFGSTACKALFKCEECKEPFDYFKCH
ncbi:1,2-phenylacetyl-CoA epoxidase subunit PaaD [Sediminibacterium sp. TEGAF015]|uniref:1,2-phenylacetyl-CoA epoxidase subunit PaaD n=1 Tax=Sediminibacterium sp. TEGAF015 TaxID=575378 RepID=UPI00220BB6F9|nr:1,2-phenylacetyl-CoA epoxidase subunit PaaD [Sediminibacterium sp. TEGAF015]BDQ13002.1 phenylacetic acid degradation protein [Sediminibacterium sp. TEGAF015]